MKLRKWFSKGYWFGLVCFAILFLASPAWGAVTFDVSSGDVDGLIVAIVAANDELVNPGEDVIVLAGGVYLLTSAYDSNQNGLPGITSAIQIVGNGSTLSRDSASGMFRFFTVEGTGSLILEDLTLQGGYADSGGALFNMSRKLEIHGGTLIGNHSVFTGGALYNAGNAWTYFYGVSVLENVSELSSGGAIYNRGTVELYDSSMTSNQSLSHGGGAIFSVMNGHVVLDRCALVDNRSNHNGGALYTYFGGETLLTNVTLSGNYSAGSGGALASVYKGMVVITASTLADNHAESSGASLYIQDDTFAWMTGSILAASNETGVSQCYENGVGGISADETSLVTDASCGDAVMTGYSDLKLGPLEYNGGSMMTHSLYDGSPAIDRVDSALMPDVDQRGVLRPQDGDDLVGALADAGAFEHETLMVIDVEPKDVTNIIPLNRGQVDVLVAPTDFLTWENLSDAEVVFGPDQAVATFDMSQPNYLKHHLTKDGLMVHFFTSETGLAATDHVACLAIRLNDGRTFRGCDSVTVVP